jgi:heat shock protein HslJ
MKYVSTSVIFIIIILLTFSSCEKKEVRQIRGIWNFVSYIQNDTIVDVSPYNHYLSFEKNNHISGSICNLVSGEYNLNKQVINISIHGLTEAYCTPSFEEPLIELLNNSSSYSIGQDTLIIFCDDERYIKLVKQNN